MSCEITEHDRTLATEVYNAVAVLDAAIETARKAGLRVVVDSMPCYIRDGVISHRLRANVSRVTTIDFTSEAP